MKLSLIIEWLKDNQHEPAMKKFNEEKVYSYFAEKNLLEAIHAKVGMQRLTGFQEGRLWLQGKLKSVQIWNNSEDNSVSRPEGYIDFKMGRAPRIFNSQP